MTCFQLDDYYSSYNLLQEAYWFYSALAPDDIELRRLGGLCGINLVDTARIAVRVDYRLVSLARDIETKCAALSDDLVHGRCLVILGIVLRHAQQWEEALHYLDQAMAMLEAVGNIFNLAEAYQAISWVHLDEGRFPEALDATEAWKYAQLTESASIQAEISLDLGRILFDTNKDAEAWEHIEIALMKASYTRDHSAVAVAQASEYMGYGYLRRGDYQNAYGAYEAAAED